MPSGDAALANRDGLNQGLVLTDVQAPPTFVDRRARELPEITDSVMLDAGALNTRQHRGWPSPAGSHPPVQQTGVSRQAELVRLL